MTWETIDPNFRTWLRTKGFGNDEDVAILEKLGGSLLRGLLMLLHVLPRASRSFQPRISNSKVKRSGVLDEDRLGKIRKSHEALMSRPSESKDVHEIGDGRKQDLQMEENAMEEGLPSTVATDDIEAYVVQSEQGSIETVFELSLDEKGKFQITLDSTNRRNTIRPVFTPANRSTGLTKGELATQLDLLAGRKIQRQLASNKWQKTTQSSCSPYCTSYSHVIN